MSKLHIFSMNNTLINLDSNVTWKELLAGEGLISADEKEKAAKFSCDCAAGNLDEAAFHASQFAGFAGKSKPEMASFAYKHFEEYLKPAINQDALAYVKALHRKGEHTALITTSNTLVAATVALYFGITDFIGSEPEIVNDIFTGNAAGTFPGINGKLFLAGRYCERFNYHAKDMICYASGVNDIRLLESCGTPIAVNPSAGLRERAEAANWQIISWAK